jgi:hypothetical protein
MAWRTCSLFDPLGHGNDTLQDITSVSRQLALAAVHGQIKVK